MGPAKSMPYELGVSEECGVDVIFIYVAVG